MRVASILAIVTVVTALNTRNPEPQFPNFGDVVDDIISGTPVVGGLLSGLAGTIGDLVNIPSNVANGLAGGFSPQDWDKIRMALGKIDTVMKPQIAAKVASSNGASSNVAKGDDPIGDLIDGLTFPFTTAGVNALSSILGVGPDLVNDVLTNLDPRNWAVLDGAVSEIKQVFVGHM